MDDYIKREDALNAICKACYLADDEDYTSCESYQNEKDTFCEYKQFLLQVPSAQPETQWIPCSERLPEEERKEYWICTDTGYQCECRWTDVNHFWTDLTTSWHWHIMDIPQYTKVVAWMPLPEPWRGEG